jgi:hypothetical protein
MDARLSDDDRRVYFHAVNNEVVVVHRATDPRNTRDVGNDALLAWGTWLVPRLSSAEIHAKTVRKLYPEARTITHTGFSLGGTVSMHLARHLGETAVTFGAFTPPRWATTDALYGLLSGGRVPSRDMVNYTVASDPICVTTNLAGWGTLVPDRGGHSISAYYSRSPP